MAQTATTLGNLGFLTISRDSAGYVGGYLVTNAWGRPLEFRLSNPVQPTRVQQILYGQSLESYLCGDLIGKTLIDKSSTPAQLLLTDHPAALELRRRLDSPLALVQSATETPPIVFHPHFTSDPAAFRELIEGRRALDLREPFARIREALAEARKHATLGRN